MKYYEIHCFIARNIGYSLFIEVEHEMNEQELIDYCADNDLFEETGDSRYVDYTTEISAKDYAEALNI